MVRVYIISRHKSTIEIIKEIFEDTNAELIIKDHVEDINEIEDNSIVIGNLPIELIDQLKNKKNCTIIVVSLNIRGKELNKEHLKLFEVQEIKLAECIFTF